MKKKNIDELIMSEKCTKFTQDNILRMIRVGVNDLMIDLIRQNSDIIYEKIERENKK